MAFAKDDLYTDMILELFKNPNNHGKLENPDLYVEGGNPLCGDQVSFTMKIENGIISDIRFYGSGCAISTAAESLLTEMVKGKKVEDAAKISQKELFAELGDIIQTRIKCALLGLVVLKKGIEEYKKSGVKRTSIRGIVV